MRIVSLFLSFAILLSAALTLPVFAKETAESNDSNIPEVDGDYQDPKDKNIRVRVFVHKEKDFQKQRGNAVAAVLDCTDYDSSAVVGWAGWKLPAGNWTYQLNSSSVPASVGSANLVTIASNGFSTWQATQNKVAFVRGSNTSITRSSYDGRNIIAWGTTSGSTLGVTYVRYYTISRIVVDVDTIMNKRVAWSWNGGSSSTCGNPNTYDAQNILVHEQGHWLGLNDHYDASYLNNTMYGYGSKGETKKNTPTTGDKAGIAAIYP